MRWKGFGPASVMFSEGQVWLNVNGYSFLHIPLQVPDKPPQAVENERSQVSDKMYRRLESVSSDLSSSPRWLTASP